MEAIAFPDGALFAVASLEVLARHTSHHVRPATDQQGQSFPLRVKREEFQLRLSMPCADVPLHTPGMLTMGELVLHTTISELQPGDREMIAHAVGVHEDFAFPSA